MWTNTPATQNQPQGGDWHDQKAPLSATSSQPGTQPQSISQPVKPAEIRVGKRVLLPGLNRKGKDFAVFTMRLGAETIELVPLKNWTQLDHFKWTARGKLPAEPAGLEIAPDHVKIAGETVSLNDPTGSSKLERLFNEWLRFERDTLELKRQKQTRPQLVSEGAGSVVQLGPLGRHFRVEVDKRDQVHIHCIEGKERLASIGLTVAGFNSLYQQGLMRKPHTLQTGALHDWVELDGELYSFEKGRNEAARLEQSLNERYITAASSGHAKEVVVLLNAAAPTGFDIQFPVLVGGVPEVHRHHLNEESLELLQDRDRCALLREEIIVKFIPPNLVFKQRTPDGGEQYLAWGPENTVNLTDDEDRLMTICLSQPLNLLRLNAAELTMVFNHPAVHRHAKAAAPPGMAREARRLPTVPPLAKRVRVQLETQTAALRKQEALSETSKPPAELSQIQPLVPESSLGPAIPEPGSNLIEPVRPSPNLWLKEVLNQPALQHDWFTCLAYGKIAEWFGNSSEGKLGPSPCWFISLSELMDIEDPAFKGIFLTEKRSLGFLNQGQIARFCNGVAFVGTQQQGLEGINVSLGAVGLDASQRVVFLLSENYRRQFGVTEAILTKIVNRLSEFGAVIMSVSEAMSSPEALNVVWTVPAEQPDPNDPQARESVRASEGPTPVRAPG